MSDSYKTICGLGLLLLMTASGCSSLTGVWGRKVEYATPGKPATEVICLWEPSEGKTPDGKPTRGFEGTLLFFDSSHSTPVGVRGEVTISVYDHYGPQQTWNKPVSEFTFSSEEWQEFLSQGTFGASYRLFIPYMRTHPYQVNTSLAVQFVPESGGPPFESRVSKVVLPGPIRETVQSSLEAQIELRDRSPETLQQFVAKSLRPHQRRARIDTIHSWRTDQNSNTGDIQFSQHQVTHGNPTETVLRLSESASRADAETWGSSPPARSSTSPDISNAEEEQPRRRFKFTQ